MPISSGHRHSREAQRTVAVKRARSRERGVALILVLMLAVTASAFVMLSALNNRSSRETAQRSVTVEALGAARRALLGYALGYADGVHTADKGPGRLPCPDLAGGSAHGVAESVGDCRAANDRETGLLPFRTLGLSALTDGSGAPLWYAVADNFRSMTSAIVNSETPGNFTVDDSDDVVAVIMAPGAPLAGQSRDAASAYSADAWLEGDNASTGDNRFTRSITTANNDTVMIITRGELMAEVAKVVNREVALALTNYFHDPDGDDDETSGADPDCPPADSACDDALPWLALRNGSNDAGLVGEGRASLARLPLVNLDTDFDATLSATWSLDGVGTLMFFGAAPPLEDCVRHTACTQMFNDKPAFGAPTPTPVSFPAPVLGTNAAPWGQGHCKLRRAATAPYALGLNCNASVRFTLPGRTIDRVWEFDVPGNTHMLPPTISARRTVEVRANGSWPAATPARIIVADYEDGTLLGAARIDFTSLGAGNSFNLSNVPFDLEVWTSAGAIDRRLSPGALPLWLYAEQWHKSVLVRYASSEAPGYSGPSCQLASSCLSLRMSHPGDAAPTTVAGIRSVVITPGPPLPAIASPTTPAQVRPSADIKDYLEGLLNPGSITSAYERREPSGTFNDQVLPFAP